MSTRGTGTADPLAAWWSPHEKDSRQNYSRQNHPWDLPHFSKKPVHKHPKIHTATLVCTKTFAALQLPV